MAAGLGLVVFVASSSVQRRPFLASSLSAAAVPVFPPMAFASELPLTVYEQISSGHVAVLPGWLPPADVTALREDARALHAAGYFTPDGLSAYEPARRGSDSASGGRGGSREVMPAFFPSRKAQGPWGDAALGDGAARRRLAARIASLRDALAVGLDRPGLVSATSPATRTVPSLRGLAQALGEISYTRYAPGASLRRHVDEHHEELKGDAGWVKLSRRSVSWLVYLNEEWNDSAGGLLRTYPRTEPSAAPVGARGGDLQVGWLRATAADPVERPVFLDARRRGSGGNCALYTESESGPGTKRRVWISGEFNAHPLLYQSSDAVVDMLLVRNPAAAGRFHLVEAPRSTAARWLGGKAVAQAGETVRDVNPCGGTLVLFDSVALPHEVMPTVGRERWACSGWLHEPGQQPGT